VVLDSGTRLSLQWSILVEGGFMVGFVGEIVLLLAWCAELDTAS
jgi:hypothetical protein